MGIQEAQKYLCLQKSIRALVLNLWVTIPSGIKWPFHRVHLGPLQNTNLYIMFVIVTQLQLWITNENNFNFMARDGGVTTTWGTVIKDCSIKNVEYHCSKGNWNVKYTGLVPSIKGIEFLFKRQVVDVVNSVVTFVLSVWPRSHMILLLWACFLSP